MTGNRDNEDRGGGGALANWDFVVSYVDADQAWATWLTWHLQAAGLRVLPLAWHGAGAGAGVSAGAGAGAADILREQAAGSDYVIAVLSSAYLAASHTAWQDNLGSGVDTDAVGLPHRLVPVRVEDCPCPEALGRTGPFDLFAIDADQAGEWLRRQVVGILDILDDAGNANDADANVGADAVRDTGVAAKRRHAPPPFPPAIRGLEPPSARPSHRPSPAGPRTMMASPSAHSDHAASGPPATAVGAPVGASPDGGGRGPTVGGTDPVEAANVDAEVEKGVGKPGVAKPAAAKAEAGVAAARAHGHVATLTGHKGGVRAVAFNPSGTLVATGGKDAKVRLWELSGTSPTPHAAATVSYGRRWNQEWVRAVTFAPGGTVLAVAGDHYTTELVDTSDPERPTTLASLVGHGGYVYAAAFSADGTMIVTGSQDRAAIVWEVTIPQTPLKKAVLAGHRRAVTGVAVTADGRRVLTASEDATLGVWELTGEARPARTTTLTGHDGPVHALTLSAQGTLLATGGKDRKVLLWDASGAVPVKITELSGHRKAVHAVAFSADALTVASADRSGTVLVWNLADPARPQLAATLTGHHGEVSGVAFSPDGRQLATAGDRAVLWSLR